MSTPLNDETPPSPAGSPRESRPSRRLTSPAELNVKESLMAASIAIDDIRIDLESLAEALCQASHAILVPPALRSSRHDPILDWEDAHRAPEATPPDGFAADCLRFLHEVNMRAWDLKDRFDNLQEADDMPTLRALIENIGDEANAHLLAALWTIRGIPTPIHLTNYRGLKREPVEVAIGRSVFAAVSSDVGRKEVSWRVEVRDRYSD